MGKITRLILSKPFLNILYKPPIKCFSRCRVFWCNMGKEDFFDRYIVMVMNFGTSMSKKTCLVGCSYEVVELLIKIGVQIEKRVVRRSNSKGEWRLLWIVGRERMAVVIRITRSPQTTAVVEWKKSFGPISHDFCPLRWHTNCGNTDLQWRLWRPDAQFHGGKPVAAVLWQSDISLDPVRTCYLKTNPWYLNSKPTSLHIKFTPSWQQYSRGL